MNKILTVILAVSLFSCKNSVDNNEIDRDTQEIYNLSLANTTGSDTLFRFQLRIPPSPAEVYGRKADKLERIKYYQRRDSLRALLDTAQLFVVLNHQIDTLYSSDVQNIMESASADKNTLESKRRDTSFNETLRDLCNNKLSFDTFDIKSLKPQFDYEIYSNKLFPDDKYRQIGIVSFSKVGFSNDKSKAAVYTKFVCPGLCGSGQILFFKKVDGNWKYIKRWKMWVS